MLHLQYDLKYFDSQAGQILRIPNVDGTDEGRYMCTGASGNIQYIKLTIQSKYINI